MGVSMLPMLAAMVSSVISGIRSDRSWISIKVEMEKGTKIIRDISLVMTMDEKKQAPVKKRASCRTVTFPSKNEGREP